MLLIRSPPRTVARMRHRQQRVSATIENSSVKKSFIAVWSGEFLLKNTGALWFNLTKYDECCYIPGLISESGTRLSGVSEETIPLRSPLKVTSGPLFTNIPGWRDFLFRNKMWTSGMISHFKNQNNDKVKYSAPDNARSRASGL